MAKPTSSPDTDEALPEWLGIRDLETFQGMQAMLAKPEHRVQLALAARYAFSVHKNHIYGGSLPYTHHLNNVFSMVIRRSHKASGAMLEGVTSERLSDECCAALLHDVLEEEENKEVKDAFLSKCKSSIRDIVTACTRPERERSDNKDEDLDLKIKQDTDYLAKIAECAEAAKTDPTKESALFVLFCDKFANLSQRYTEVYEQEPVGQPKPNFWLGKANKEKATRYTNYQLKLKEICNSCAGLSPRMAGLSRVIDSMMTEVVRMTSDGSTNTR